MDSTIQEKVSRAVSGNLSPTMPDKSDVFIRDLRETITSFRSVLAGCVGKDVDLERTLNGLVEDMSRKFGVSKDKVQALVEILTELR